jgi:hypothetical protein
MGQMRSIMVWVAVTFGLNLVWEVGQILFYTLWAETDLLTITNAVVHCSLRSDDSSRCLPYRGRPAAPSRLVPGRRLARRCVSAVFRLGVHRLERMEERLCAGIVDLFKQNACGRRGCIATPASMDCCANSELGGVEEIGQA